MCNDDGTGILNEILIKRKAYKNIKALQNDVEANNYIEVLKNWDTIRWKCLKTLVLQCLLLWCNDQYIQAIKMN